MSEISVNNLTETQIDGGLIKDIFQRVLAGERKKGDISLAFVGPGRIRHLNKKYMGRNKATDVLSFSEPGLPLKKFFSGETGKNKNIGEIIICPKEIKKNAGKFKTSFKKELIRVLIHGILHLLGYEHEGVGREETEKMRKREEKYLKELENRG